MMNSYTGRLTGAVPTREQRWALAGFVLALVLLALLVTVMRENAALVQSSHDVNQQKMQERGRCNVMQDRRERGQCLLELRLAEQAQVAER